MKKTWGHLIKTYNTSASGNVEQFSICSNDSIWEDDEKMSTNNININNNNNNRLCDNNDDSSTSDHYYQPRRHRYVRNKNYDLDKLLQKFPNNLIVQQQQKSLNGKCDYFNYQNFYPGSIVSENGIDNDLPYILKRPISLNISQEQCFQVQI